MNINELRKLGSVEIFPDEEDLFVRLNQIKARFDVSTDEARQAHDECDYRLVEKLESSLTPVLGMPGSSGCRWFHLVDSYGDGIRFIEAEWTTLTLSLITLLRKLLCGEHEQFCVAWNSYEDFHGEQNGMRGSVVVLAGCILVTQSVLG